MRKSLLDFLAEYNGDKPGYVVAERLLDKSNNQLAHDVNEKKKHLHIFSTDGKNNAGFFREGIRQEPSERFADYVLSKEYGEQVFAADAMERVLREKEAEEASLLDMLEELDREPMNEGSSYFLPLRNCQDFVHDSTRRTRRYESDMRR